MTEEPERGSGAHPFSDAELTWVRDHLTELRETAAGQRILWWYLGSAFAVGLAAQIVGYVLRPATPSEPLGLIADLVYALGWALWTGVVVTLFVQLLPEMKRRQISRALVQWEAALQQPASENGAKAQVPGAAPARRRRRRQPPSPAGPH